MASIFISHNSNDAKEAAALKRWLVDNGWDDVFLDIDEKDGLIPGERWKDALRTAADRCEAVLCLVSPTWLTSAECKLEFRYAEQLRKHLFLAIIKPCEKANLPPDWQWCWLYGEGAQTPIHFEFREQPTECFFLSDGLQRLKNGLEKAGISAEHFPWPPDKEPDRAPYRGLKPLEAADAAVFFGRNAQILHGMETLWDMRRTGMERLLVILGASGAGKSSFMRAGLLPRLRRDDRQFFPLPVIRPRNAVLFGTEGLAVALTAAFAPVDGKITLREIEKRLSAGSEAFDALWQKLEQYLFNRSGGEVDQQPPSIVIPVDQAEELFNPDGAMEAESFLALLAGLMVDSDTATGSGKPSGQRGRAIIVLTIRSDRYERLQIAPRLSSIKRRLFDLQPFLPSQFERVINGPAERAIQAGRKLKIDPRLSDRLLADFTGGADTLPLLGFALEKLYHKYGRDGDLTLEEYEDIRGSHETVQAAIFQEAIDTALAEPYRPPIIPADRTEQYQGVRRAFIPFLARINPESNEPMRQLAKLQDLPAAVRPLVERLVEARLLVHHKDTIEVAHESLLRQWPSFRGWFTEDLDKLRLLATIRNAAAGWQKEGQREDLLIHRNGRLQEAEVLLAMPGYVVAADSDERAYLSACNAAQRARETAEKEEQERRIRDAERIAKEQKRAKRAILIGLMVAAVVAGFATWQWRQAKIGQISALTESSRTQFYLNRNSFDALLKALESASRLKSLPGGGASSELRHEVVRTLGQAVHWVMEKNRLEGHSNNVQDVSFSRDGKIMVTAGYDKAVKFWRPNGELICTAEGHTDGVMSVSFSPDGKMVASAGEDAQIKLWWAPPSLEDSTQTASTIFVSEWNRKCQLRHTITASNEVVYSVNFSPDGQTLVSGGGDKTVKLWSLDGEPLGTMLGHTDPIWAVEFSPDGETIASTSWDTTTKLWHTRTRQLQETLRQEASVWGLSFSPDGQTIATGGIEGTVKLWNLRGELQQTLKGHTGIVKGMSFSLNGHELATAGDDGTVKLWCLRGCLRDGALIETLNGHATTVNNVIYSPDGSILASASHDKTVKLWKRERQARFFHTGHGGVLYHVHFSPDGQTILTASDDKTARLFKRDGALLQTFTEHNESVTDAQWSPDGQRIATSSLDKTVKLLTRQGELLKVITGHTDLIWSVHFSPDGQTLATASKDKTARLWNLQGREEKTLLQGHQGWVYEANFSPNGQRLVTASEDHTAKLWKHDGTLLRTLEHGSSGVLNAVFSPPDGQMIATVSRDGTAKLWDLNGKVLCALTGHTDAIWGVDFSPDGHLLATASNDKSIKLWKVEDCSLIMTLMGHQTDIPSVSFSPDGKSLVSAGSKDKDVILWDINAIDLEGLLSKGCEQISDYLQTNARAPKELSVCRKHLPPPVGSE